MIRAPLMKQSCLFIACVFLSFLQFFNCSKAWGAPKYSVSPTIRLLEAQEEVFQLQRKNLLENAQKALNLDQADLERRVQFLKATNVSVRASAFSPSIWVHLDGILKLDELFKSEKERVGQERLKLARLSFQQRLELLASVTRRLQQLTSQESLQNSGGFRSGVRPLALDAPEVQRLIEQILILRDVDSRLPVLTAFGFDVIHFSALVGLWVFFNIPFFNNPGVFAPATLLALIAYQVYIVVNWKKQKTLGTFFASRLETAQISNQQRRRQKAEPALFLEGALSSDPIQLPALYQEMVRVACESALLEESVSTSPETTGIRIAGESEEPFVEEVEDRSEAVAPVLNVRKL